MPKNEKQEKGRYWVRLLIGYNLETLSKLDNLEEAISIFGKVVNTIGEKGTKAPYMVFLVDAQEDRVIMEKTVTPDKTENKA